VATHPEGLHHGAYVPPLVTRCASGAVWLQQVKSPLPANQVNSPAEVAPELILTWPTFQLRSEFGAGGNAVFDGLGDAHRAITTSRPKRKRI